MLTLNETCSDPISKFGNAAQKAEFLNDFASGRKLVSASSSRTRRPLRVRQQLACASIRQHPSAFSAHPSVCLSVCLSVCPYHPPAETRARTRAETRARTRADPRAQGCFALSEPGNGSDAGAALTTATKVCARAHSRRPGVGGWMCVCVWGGGGG